MKKLFLIAVAFSAAVCVADTVTTNQSGRVQKTVVTVDQLGKLNVTGIASVTDVATNAVKVQVAEAAASAAQNTARSVTNALDGIVQNIMANNTVIYRHGYTDSFSSLVIIGADDKVVISDFQHVISGTTLTATIRYVCTVNVGAVKPIVYANSELDVGKENFPVVADANVTAPVYHAETVVIGDETYNGYYEIVVTVPNLTDGKQYFFWIKIDPDVPSGDGMSLELPNGVVGGVTTTVIWGDKRLTFYKGMLLGVQDAN